jgi:hypothetical protein
MENIYLSAERLHIHISRVTRGRELCKHCKPTPRGLGLEGRAECAPLPSSEECIDGP